MGATKKGIYHNLKESKYTISNAEVVFFFSSKFYLRKFMERYETYREEFLDKAEKVLESPYYNLDMLADIALYKTIEKRGFHAMLMGVDINCKELDQYALRKMTELNSNDWLEMPMPRSDGHKRITV